MLVRLSSAVWHPLRPPPSHSSGFPFASGSSNYLLEMVVILEMQPQCLSIFFSSERGGPRGCLTLQMFSWSRSAPQTSCCWPHKGNSQACIFPSMGPTVDQEGVYSFFLSLMQWIKSPFLSQALVQRNWQFLRLHFIKTPSINETNNQHYY